MYVYTYIYCMFFAGTVCFIVMDHRSADSFPAYHGRCSTASKVEIHLQKNDIKLPNTQPVKIRNDFKKNDDIHNIKHHLIYVYIHHHIQISVIYMSITITLNNTCTCMHMPAHEYVRRSFRPGITLPGWDSQPMLLPSLEVWEWYRSRLWGGPTVGESLEKSPKNIWFII